MIVHYASEHDDKQGVRCLVTGVGSMTRVQTRAGDRQRQGTRHSIPVLQQLHLELQPMHFFLQLHQLPLHSFFGRGAVEQLGDA